MLQSFTFSLDNIYVGSYEDSRTSCRKFEFGCSTKYFESINGSPVPMTAAIERVRIVITIANKILEFNTLMKYFNLVPNFFLGI